MQTRERLPDFHFLLIADNLGPEWFFDAAREYWERFRPTVISDLLMARLVSREFSMAVTAVVGRDRVAEFGVAMAQVIPAALYDPVVRDSFAETRDALTERARTNQPFGQPLAITIVPTLEPNLTPVQPTLGPVIGGPTPTPRIMTSESTPPPIPTSPPLPPPDADNPQGPIYPTPGPINGTGG